MGERLDQLGVHPRLLLVRQVVGDVAPLVQGAALDQRLVAEHLAHRGRQSLAPSSTTSSPSSKRRPRSTRSASRAWTTVVFSVEPSQSPTGFLVPSSSRLPAPGGNARRRSAASRALQGEQLSG